MMKHKLTAIAGVGLLSLFWSSVTLSLEVGCDEGCKASIEFQNKLDSKDMEIMLMQKELNLIRLSSEINELSKGGSNNNDVDRLIEELSEKISSINKKVDETIVSRELEPQVNDDINIDIVNDTTGIKNVFVTETSSVGGEWRARVYYDNSVQDLYIGEIVFPGAKVKSISRRGAILDYNGDEHYKMITPAEVAQARAFNNIKEERELKKGKLELQLRGGVSSYESTYF